MYFKFHYSQLFYIDSFMPIVIRCKNCGEVFYIGYNIINLERFVSSLEICKYCGKKLDISNNLKIVIRSIDEEQ